MKKKVLDLFKKSSSEILFSVFCLSIVAIGMGFFYWHLQNLDFFSFKVLSEGVIKLNGDQIKEILRIEFFFLILMFGLVGLFFCLGYKQKTFIPSLVLWGKGSLIGFLSVFGISLLIPTATEQYVGEHLHQLLFIIEIALIVSLMAYSLPKKNMLSNFIVRNSGRIFWGILIFFLVWYLTVGMVKFLHISHGGLDYTFFTQGLWHYARLEEPIITYGGATKNLHAEHAHLFLIFLAPLWALFDTPFTLLFVDVIAMLSMVIPLYLIAKDKVQSVFFQLSLVVGVCFFFGIQRALEHEFHEANLIAPLFVWSFYFLYKSKMKFFWGSLVLLLLSKESSPIWAMFLGLYAIFFQKQVKVGGIIILLSALYFPLVLGWIIPDLLGNGSYQHFSFKELGNTPGEVIRAVLTNPIYALHILFNPSTTYLGNLGDNAGLVDAMSHMKQNTISHMFASFGYLSLLSPQILFLGIPMLGERFLNSDDWRWSIYLYYNISFLPILALGMIYGSKNLIDLKIWNSKTKAVLPVFLAVIVLGMSVMVNPKKSPMLMDVFRENFWTFTPKEKTIWELTRLIPKDATVQTQSTILPFFAHRDYIKAFPRGQHESGEYLSGHNYWMYERHQDRLANDAEFAHKAEFFKQEPEYTILNSDFIAYPLRAKEDVEAWITKLRGTHDVFYEKFGTVVFKRRDSDTILKLN